MAEINATNYHDIKFTRDTKVDYQKGDAVINTVFKKFDTNLDGEFNDVEWVTYCEHLTEQSKIQKLVANVNNNTTKYYDAQLAKLVEKNNEMCAEWETMTASWGGGYSNYIRLYEEHPEVEILLPGEGEIPVGALKYDISPLGVGIMDDDGNFTGECATVGYITGLESLSEEERKEFLDSLDAWKKECELMQDYDKRYEELIKQFSSYLVLSDYAKCGLIQGAVGEEKAKTLIEIHNQANPFLKELKELEAKRQQLWLKGSKTEEDFQQLQAYNIQIGQLQNASLTWSIADAEESVLNELGQKGFTSSFTPLQITYSDGTLSNTASGTFNYQNDNWSVNGAVTGTLGIGVKEFDIKKSFTGNLNAGYAWDKVALTSSSRVDLQETMKTYEQKFGLRRGGLNLGIGETIVTTEVQGEKGAEDVTTFTTDAKASYTIGGFSVNASASVTPRTVTEINGVGQPFERKFVDYAVNAGAAYKINGFTNSAGVTLGTDGQNIYTLSSAANYMVKINDNWMLTGEGSLAGAYNEGAKNFTVSPYAKAGLSYTQVEKREEGDFERYGWNLTVEEQHNTTLPINGEVTTNHNFTASSEFRIENGKYKITANFNDSDSPETHSNTYGLGFGYDMGKYGKIGVNASYQFTNNKSVIIPEGLSPDDLKEALNQKYSKTPSISLNYTLTF